MFVLQKRVSCKRRSADWNKPKGQVDSPSKAASVWSTERLGINGTCVHYYTTWVATMHVLAASGEGVFIVQRGPVSVSANDT